MAGYVHLRAQTPEGGPTGSPDPARALAAAVRQELRPLAERIDRLVEHVGLAAGSDRPPTDSIP